MCGIFPKDGCSDAAHISESRVEAAFDEFVFAGLAEKHKGVFVVARCAVALGVHDTEVQASAGVAFVADLFVKGDGLGRIARGSASFLMMDREIKASVGVLFLGTGLLKRAGGGFEVAGAAEGVGVHVAEGCAGEVLSASAGLLEDLPRLLKAAGCAGWTQQQIACSCASLGLSHLAGLREVLDGFLKGFGFFGEQCAHAVATTGFFHVAGFFEEDACAFWVGHGAFACEVECPQLKAADFVVEVTFFPEMAEGAIQFGTRRDLAFAFGCGEFAGGECARFFDFVGAASHRAPQQGEEPHGVKKRLGVSSGKHGAILRGVGIEWSSGVFITVCRCCTTLLFCGTNQGKKKQRLRKVVEASWR